MGKKTINLGISNFNIIPDTLSSYGPIGSGLRQATWDFDKVTLLLAAQVKSGRAGQAWPHE